MAVLVEKLKTAPDDPAANLAVGSYTCFNKGDWEHGLPMLAKGSDANLKKLAILEITRPTTPDDLMRLGDGWWDFGAKQPDVIRGEIYQHAASIYNAALPNVTGLRRTLMEHRIADAGTAQTVPMHPDAAPSGGFVNSIGMKFVRISQGIFSMGSPPNETGHYQNETLHRVKISKAFMMATTTVTQAQWKALMDKNPSHFQGNNRPVENVSWNDAMAFCEKLSEKEAKHYRLPTEAEWEYACRAGTQSPYNFGDGRPGDFAWYDANSGKETHDVATKRPNRWGLYDMGTSGNCVWTVMLPMAAMQSIRKTPAPLDRIPSGAGRAKAIRPACAVRSAVVAQPAPDTATSDSASCWIFPTNTRREGSSNPHRRRASIRTPSSTPSA